MPSVTMVRLVINRGKEMEDIECPHCGHVQADMHNGGDPGPWWNNEYIPDGELMHQCDYCQEEFIIEVSWDPNFTSRKTTEEDL